jgi:hypothetical protein
MTCLQQSRQGLFAWLMLGSRRARLTFPRAAVSFRARNISNSPALQAARSAAAGSSGKFYTNLIQQLTKHQSYRPVNVIHNIFAGPTG